jgi:nitrate/nitrite transport system substrate-binding protein
VTVTEAQISSPHQANGSSTLSAPFGTAGLDELIAGSTQSSTSLASSTNTALHGGSCACSACVQPGSSHEAFLADMPQEPEQIMDDLQRMGLVNPAAYPIADAVSAAELRQALFFRHASQGNPHREALLRALAEEAGGLDQAFAAAFGPQAGAFFGKVRSSSPLGRRTFLKGLAAGAALVTLTNCGVKRQADGGGGAVDVGNLEKKSLKVGFIPITCATPIIMAKPMGFYERYGMNVEVVKMPSWGAVRDSAIAGELDAYHMLAPMPIAMTLGLGTAPFSVKLASIENINGQAITVAKRHAGKVKEAKDFKGFVIGVPFPFSMHNLLLRYYLAQGGINPDTDVQIRPVPPPDSIAQLVAGDLDAMLMPDPFNQRAVYEDAGFIHLLTKDLWDGHPCCAFATGEPWIQEHPLTFQALNKAIIEAAGYAHEAKNRSEIAKAISGRGYLNQPPEVVEAVLTGKFENGLGQTLDVPDRIDFNPYPWQSFANWIQSQLVRWDLGKAAAAIQAGDFDANSASIFLTSDAQKLETEMGLNPPKEQFRVEKLAYDTFNPQQPMQYIEEQKKRDGF